MKSRTLPDFTCFFDSYHTATSASLPHVITSGSFEFGNVIFVHPRVHVHKQIAHIIHPGQMTASKEVSALPRNIQLLHTTRDGRDLTVANMHGLWIPDFGKGDHESRITQSQRVHDILQNVPGSKVLMGDLNLNPDTESLKILGKDMCNLIDEYHITNTRSSHYQKPAKFADHAFVSPDIKVLDFQVLSDEISDHLPLQLDIE